MIKLKKEIDFIPAQDLLSEVRNEVSIYFERSLVDYSILYPVIRHCLAKIGAKIYPVGNTILRVNNYETNLPYDFHKLILALGCFDYKLSYTNDNPQIYDVNDTQIEDFLINKPSYTGIDTLDNGDTLNIIQRFETFSVTYQSFYNLSVSKNSIPFCSNNCFNKLHTSQDQIELDLVNKKLRANFDKGSIYMDYLQNLEIQDMDEGGTDLLIPNFSQITEWIKAACITKTFRYLMYNTTTDVQARLRDAERIESILQVNAKTFVSRVEFKDMYDMRKLFMGRFDKFNQMIYGPREEIRISKNYNYGIINR